MIICIHNQSNLNLAYTTFSKYHCVYGKGSKYLNIDGCNKIIFYFEIAHHPFGYTRYYKEICTDDIKQYDIYVNFIKRKLYVFQEL